MEMKMMMVVLGWTAEIEGCRRLGDRPAVQKPRRRRAAAAGADGAATQQQHSSKSSTTAGAGRGEKE